MLSTVIKAMLTPAIVLALLFLNPESVWSQQQRQMRQKPTEVSDKELKRFSRALDKVQTIQDSTHQEMVSAIENAGLDVDTYNQIVKELQGAQSVEEVNATQEEMQQVQQASQEVQQIQASRNEEIVLAIREEELEPQRFQTIMEAVQREPVLMQRMQNLDQN